MKYPTQKYVRQSFAFRIAHCPLFYYIGKQVRAFMFSGFCLIIPEDGVVYFCAELIWRTTKHEIALCFWTQTPLVGDYEMALPRFAAVVHHIVNISLL